FGAHGSVAFEGVRCADDHWVGVHCPAAPRLDGAVTSELRLRSAGPHLDAALVEPAIGPGTPTSVIRRRDRLVALLRRHRVMAVLVALGFALRVLTWLAYQPALLFTDSQYYLQNVGPLDPQYLDPIGYPLLVLKPLLPLGWL